MKNQAIKVVFRVDASSVIGMGHVMRCLVLADSLCEWGAEVLFVCRTLNGHLCSLIEGRGFAVARLDLSRQQHRIGLEQGYASWLGVPWQEDVEQTRRAIEAAGIMPDWLVVDHYALDYRWESSLRKWVKRILAIDDLCNREHDCDVLLDQNLVAQMQTRYAGRVHPTCRLLLGPKYALLQPIFADLHNSAKPREGSIRRILVSFGGADNHNLTGRVISALLQFRREGVMVDVVVNGDSPYLGDIQQKIAGQSNFRLYSNLPTLAPLMAEVDLAIGACGVTSWERLCLGLPTLVITLAENQRPIAEELNRRGLVVWLGHQGEVSESDIAQALSGLMDRVLDGAWSKRCFAIVDGKGAGRVRAILTAATVSMRVRQADLRDEALLLDLANDPVTRSNSFSSAPITAATHQAWFRGRLCDAENCRLYIVETSEGAALGQVRFERHDQAWEVHYAVAPTYRGRGLGRAILESALLKFCADMAGGLIYGKVKNSNLQSRKIFESLGFEARTNPDGMVVYQREFRGESTAY